MVQGRTAQIDVVIGLFARGQSHLAVHNGKLLDQFRETLLLVFLQVHFSHRIAPFLEFSSECEGNPWLHGPTQHSRLLPLLRPGIVTAAFILFLPSSGRATDVLGGGVEAVARSISRSVAEDGSLPKLLARQAGSS